MAARPALAALGQAQLMGLWQRFFERPVAQVLLTHDDLRNRRRYLNARAPLNELLRLGALPVVNENDTVSVDELKLGDNDNLAATVAALVDADALFIATDIDGTITLFNTGAQRLLGYSAADVVGQRRLDAFHDPQELNAWLRPLADADGQLPDVFEALSARAD
ncbi:amino acid kinase family protein, partial [Acinetobacter indicus]|uniref:amino acid kinase family protein n=1 Tax=Acinetobacter indicus TaxID=756892 RepID=UPI001C08FA25